MNSSLDEVMRQVGEPLEQVELKLRTAFDDASNEARAVALHLIESGGKRVRPVMTLLAARLFSSEVSRAVPAAVAAEMIHMATLVHDDVIDYADTRRGRPTVNAVWNGHTAVLAGDALLARALVILVQETTPEVVSMMSDMIYRMCEGEIAQNATRHNVNETEESYYRRIEKKTALFFAASCRAGALLGGADAAQADAMWEYGRNIGLAFQVVDDLLDITADEEVLGKPVGSDLASGVLTLPVLHAMKAPAARDSIRKVLADPPLSAAQVDEVLGLVRANGALAYTQSAAISFADTARSHLRQVPPGPTNDLLATIAAEVVTRDY